jgi:hypothetical protein
MWHFWHINVVEADASTREKAAQPMKSKNLIFFCPWTTQQKFPCADWAQTPRCVNLEKSEKKKKKKKKQVFILAMEDVLYHVV